MCNAKRDALSCPCGHAGVKAKVVVQTVVGLLVACLGPGHHLAEPVETTKGGRQQSMVSVQHAYI